MAIDFTWVKNAATREAVWREYRRIRDAMQEDVVDNVRAEFFAKYDMPRTARRLGIDVSVDESSGKPRIDLDNEQQLDCFVVDRGFSQTFEMRRNLGMFTGLHPFADPKLRCVMTGGAGLPVPLKDIESVLEKLLKALKIKKRPPLELSEGELARFVAASINQAFRAGSSEIIRYE